MHNTQRKTNAVCSAFVTAIIALLLSAITWTQLVTRLYVAQFTESSLPVEAVAVATQGQRETPSAPEAPTLTATVIPSVGVDHPAAPSWEVSTSYQLEIPAIHVSVPVSIPSRRYWDAKAWDLLEEQMQVALLGGAVAYPHSAAPGALGTLLVAAHSSPPSKLAAASAYGNVFAELPNLGEGDEIHVKAGSRDFVYRVQRAEVFAASDTYILAQQGEERLLKLITCYPIGTAKDRWVVTAVLDE